jgi:acyl carrier protein
MEQQLVDIWAQVLNLESEKIGVDDNFFELGGHSLLATQVISKIRSQLAIDLPQSVLFQAKTIAGTSEIINAIKCQYEQPLDADSGNVEYEEVSL